MQTNAALDRTLSLGICTWLAIVEQDADRLATPAAPPSAQLRHDLNQLAADTRPASRPRPSRSATSGCRGRSD
jgi:hypothetical protein